MKWYNNFKHFNIFLFPLLLPFASSAVHRCGCCEALNMALISLKSDQFRLM